MRFTVVFTLFGLLAACGGDDGGGSGSDSGVGSADAPPAPAMITISGEATKRDGANQSAAEGAVVAAYTRSDPNTPIAMTTTDAAGNYTMTIATGGVAVDGYIKATLATYKDLYLYPPKPLTADFAGASLNIVNQNTVNLMHALCQVSADDTKAIVALIVADSAEEPVAGATVSTTPTIPKYCFNGTSGLPDGGVNGPKVTAADGVAYALSITPGEVTVSASKSGTTFSSHKVNAPAGALTTTVIQP